MNKFPISLMGIDLRNMEKFLQRRSFKDYTPHILSRRGKLFQNSKPRRRPKHELLQSNKSILMAQTNEKGEDVIPPFQLNLKLSKHKAQVATIAYLTLEFIKTSSYIIYRML